MNILDKHSSPNSVGGPASVGVASGSSTPSSIPSANCPLPASSSSSSIAPSPSPLDCLGPGPGSNQGPLMSNQQGGNVTGPQLTPNQSQSSGIGGSSSQLGPGSVGGPPSVSSVSGPHTPLMMESGINGPPPPPPPPSMQQMQQMSQNGSQGPNGSQGMNCGGQATNQSGIQTDLNSQSQQQQQQQQQQQNGRSNNVSTPSSMFNSSAPNTPAMSGTPDLNLPNIQSPALHSQQMSQQGPPPPPQMDSFCEAKLYSHGPSSVPPPTTQNCAPPSMSPAPMSVPPPGCGNEPIPKTKGKRKASTNSNNNNTGNGSNFQNPDTPGTPGPNTSNGMMSNNIQMKSEPMISPFGGNGMTPSSMNLCMPPMNGTISPFDSDSKGMGMFPMNDFNPNNMPNDPCGMPPLHMRNQSHPPGPPNCSMAMNMPPGPGMGLQGPPPSLPPGMSVPPPPPPPHLGNQMPPGMMGPGIGPGPPSMKASPMDPQYMQHQSQIFVFSTTMANQAADSVHETSIFETIIDFHLAQPTTKEFMDKHDVKIHNVNKTRGNTWGMRPGGPGPSSMRIRGPNPNGMCPPRPGFAQQPPPPPQCFPPYNDPSPGPNGQGPMSGYGGPPPPMPPNSWPPPPNHMGSEFGGPRGPRPGFGGPPPGGMPPNFNKFNPNNSNYSMGNDSQDLTPQQRANREQKLAILQNIKETLCPEMNDSPGIPPGMGVPPNDFVGMDHPGMGMPGPGPGMPGSGPGMIGPGPGDIMPPFGGPQDGFNPNYPPQPPPGMPPNSMIGGHLQPGGPMFPDEQAPPPPPPAPSGRKRKNQAQQQQPQQQQAQQQQSQAPPGVNSPNSMGPNRVPPPPYNTGLHRQMSSPHPASPATSLGMPSTSPRGQSYGPPRSGQTTPVADSMVGGPIGTSPKSRSPGNKRSKAAREAAAAAAALSLENDLMGFPNKSEPALMPVPSPKQLDYNHTFEGQELTIEKQPNMHFQDNDFLASGDMQSDLFGNEFDPLTPNDGMSGPGRPFSNPGPGFGSGPNGFNGPPSDAFRGPPPPNQFRTLPCDPSMNKPTFSSDMNFGPGVPPPPGPPMGLDSMMFPNGVGPSGFNDPSALDSPMGSSHLASLQKMAPPFDMKDGPMMSGPKGVSGMSNNGPMMSGGSGVSRFDSNFPPEMNDPNYSLHMQGPPPPMSGGYPGGPPGPPGPGYNNGPGRMQPGTNGEMLAGFPPGMHPNNQYLGQPMMDGPGSNGPSPMPMMGPGGGPSPRFQHNQGAPRPPMNPSPVPSQSPNPRYDFSPNVQVKPNAPNTIQYLPNRPQGPPCPPNSRPAPNLDFLQQSLNIGSGGGIPPPGNKSSNMNGGTPGSPFYPGGPSSVQMPPRPPGMQPHMNFGPRGPPQTMMRPGMVPNSQDMLGQRPPPPGSGRPMGVPPNGGPTPPGFGPGSGMPPLGNKMGGPPGPPGIGQGPPHPGPPQHGDGQFNNYKNSFQAPPPDMAFDPGFHAFQQKLYGSNNNARSAPGPRMPY